MRVAFIGDVVGRPGRGELAGQIPLIREKFALDFVVANCENASGGFGLSAKNALEILECGVDCITGGNHSFDKKDVMALMDKLPILRPYNHYKGTAGRGVVTLQKDDKSLSVINLMGVIGYGLTDNAFLSIKDAIKECQSPNILVDFHAEMTSEKNALLCDNMCEVGAIFGTHTHVGTDDLRIINGCAYVSDVGLSGALDGVIGMDAQPSIAAFKTGLKYAFGVNTSYRTIFQCVVADMSDGVCTHAFKYRKVKDKEYISEALV